MKSKGAIKFFAIALTMVCLYHLSFTFVAWRVEKKAQEFAQGDVEKERRYLDSIANESVYNLLIRDYTYQQVKERELNLGLDLRGGMHVTLEVDVRELLVALSNENNDPAFRNALDRGREMHRADPQTDYITHFRRAFEEESPDGRLAAIFSTRETRDQIGPQATNAEVTSYLRQQSRDALDVTHNIIRSRIDRYGVTQPNIQKQEASGRILVELPGVDDPQRVRRLLQESAELAFWETYEMEEIASYLEQANEVLAESKKREERLRQDDGDIEDILNEDEAEDADAFDESDEMAEESDAVEGELDEDDLFADDLADGDEDTIDPDDDLFDDADPDDMAFEDYEREFPLYAVLQPNFQEVGGEAYAGQGPVVGYARPRDTSQVNSYLSRPDIRGLFPPDLRFAWAAHPFQGDDPFYELIALRTTRDGTPPLDGSAISEARQDFSRENRPVVTMRMTNEGARIWANLTGDNLGRSVAIVLDDQVISFPTVQSRIVGGRSEITGNFTVTEAQDLANILRSGRLPLSTQITQEAVVGPTMGVESIQRGTLSLVVGIMLVLLFMALYYNTSGFVANFALVANLFFIVGVLSSLGAALTLPGIAGIVLTMGMSVDANVLIFQRIREELKEGKGIKMAIADGYRNAYSSIIDANLTTLLTAIILFTFGSGPIQGFATILIIGILTSLFSAIFITRLVFEWGLDRDKNISFGNRFTINAFENLNFDFLGKRKIMYSISGLVILMGIISLSTRGLEYGVDFRGGYSYVVRFDQNLTTNEIRDVLQEPFQGVPEVKTFGGASQHRITTDYRIDDPSDDAAHEVEQTLSTALAGLVGAGNFEILTTEKVGPTIADDIRRSAVWSVIFALIVIFLYIFIRFRRWQFGAGALIALFHDVLILLSVFSLLRGVLPFSLEIDQAFIAALLTTVGYSINDSVVVFDRIRETLSFYRKKPLLQVVNTALNLVFSRTIVTSVTTLLVVLVLFIFGGEMIRGFAFALLIGVIVGTYSSIFIATPALVDLQRKQLETIRDEVIQEEEERKRRKKQKEKV